MATYAKGSVARAGHEHIRKTFGDDVWKRAVDSLLPDESATVRNLTDATPYPIAIDGRIFTFVCNDQFGGDPQRMGMSMRSMGAGQADEMLNGIFSVFARFVSPQQAFARAGSIISSAYTGVTHSTEPREDGRGGVLRMCGFGELSYGAASISGWIERALARFGASNPRVVERHYANGVVAAEELVFDLTWD